MILFKKMRVIIFIFFFFILVYPYTLFAQTDKIKFVLGPECYDVVRLAKILPEDADYIFEEKKIKKKKPTRDELSEFFYGMHLLIKRTVGERERKDYLSDSIEGLTINLLSKALDYIEGLSKKKQIQLYFNIRFLKIEKIEKKYPKLSKPFLIGAKIWMCRRYTSLLNKQIIVGPECFDVVYESGIVPEGYFVRFRDESLHNKNIIPLTKLGILTPSDLNEFFLEPLLNEVSELKKLLEEQKEISKVNLFYNLQKFTISELIEHYPQLSSQSLRKAKIWMCRWINTKYKKIIPDLSDS